MPRDSKEAWDGSGDFEDVFVSLADISGDMVWSRFAKEVFALVNRLRMSFLFAFQRAEIFEKAGQGVCPAIARLFCHD